jgi:hypothetical protein
MNSECVVAQRQCRVLIDENEQIMVSKDVPVIHTPAEGR